MDKEQIYDETVKYANYNKFKTSQKIDLVHIRLNPELSLEEAIIIYNLRNKVALIK